MLTEALQGLGQDRVYDLIGKAFEQRVRTMAGAHHRHEIARRVLQPMDPALAALSEQGLRSRAREMGLPVPGPVGEGAKIRSVFKNTLKETPTVELETLRWLGFAVALAIVAALVAYMRQPQSEAKKEPTRSPPAPHTVAIFIYARQWRQQQTHAPHQQLVHGHTWWAGPTPRWRELREMLSVEAQPDTLLDDATLVLTYQIRLSSDDLPKTRSALSRFMEDHRERLDAGDTELVAHPKALTAGDFNRT